ncbi:hypothetical protein LPN01_16965 [Sphingomonas sp. A2-49]|uniref:hypothetical protein n=1 Tax=Sphingomonas sp. A2-49 TaxID=1391375 RepID=UPI0021D1CA1E|nr:hypothetical protein [Sphingomonas sp. A2-49]MCU6455773.1 hypothetical protein [Sphingomonas sp. A2-49]
MTRTLLFAAATLALPLAACDRSGTGTSVSINTDGGNTLAAVDGRSGEVKIAVPGFSGQIKLPRLQLDANDFDLNGVHLYPGSTIEAVDVGAADRSRAGLRVRFTSPATPEQVRDWFERRLGKAGFALHRDGAGLSGTTDEHKPFRLDLTAADPTHAKGSIVLGN